MKKKYKYWLLKDNYIYTVKELAIELGVHDRSIQRFIQKDNFPVIDKTHKPYLIKGREAKEFFKVWTKRRKFITEYYEFNCMKCKKAVQSIPEKVKFEFSEKRLGKNAFQASVRGICINCGSKLYRLSSDKKLPEIKRFYEQKLQKTKPAKSADKQQQLSLFRT